MLYNIPNLTHEEHTIIVSIVLLAVQSEASAIEVSTEDWIKVKEKIDKFNSCNKEKADKAEITLQAARKLIKSYTEPKRSANFFSDKNSRRK